MIPTERRRHELIEPLDRMEMMSAQFYRHAYTTHYHDTYTMALILDGAETYQWEGRRHVASAGSMIVINPGEIHDGRAVDPDEGWKYCVIYPTARLMRSCLTDLERDPDRLPRFPDTVVRDPKARALFTAFVGAWRGRDTLLGVQSLFLELVHRFIRNHAHFPEGERETDIRDTATVDRVLEKIRARYHTALTLESLAREEGISPFALLRLFKKHTRVSPYLTQTHLRIQNAKTCLRAGTPLADTAVACGYTDQSHLTRQFKRWTGITPGEYLGSSALGSGRYASTVSRDTHPPLR